MFNKTFTVKGAHSQRAKFRILEHEGTHCVFKKEQIKTILRNLPMRFNLVHAKTLKNSERPIEVCVDTGGCNIISVYPPKGTILSGASFQAWEFYPITSKMRVDNIMDDDGRERKNIRSCVHFQPSILGVSDWPKKNKHGWENDIKLDIFKYPRD